MNDFLFTVFTPTYNRAHTLPRLYQSLCAQRVRNFEWLIIDDGSTDGTEDLVNGWQREEQTFPIRYVKKANGGKPRAINDGVQIAQGRYIHLMDSDDYMTPDAMEKLTRWVAEIDQDDRFIGVGGACGYENGAYIKGVPPQVNRDGYVDATNLERARYALDADMTEAYKLDIFRRFPMAQWPGENFAPEQIALNEMALAGYKLRWHRDIILIKEYMEDGLTRGAFDLERKNPMGYAMMYNHKLKYPGISMKERFHAACQHVALSLVGKHPAYILKSHRPLLTLLALPAGWLLSFRRRKQFNQCI